MTELTDRQIAINARLRAILAAKGWTSRHWSLASGASNAHLDHVMSGRISSPSGAFWMNLAEAAGTSVAYLLDGDGPMFRAPIDEHGARFPARQGLVFAALALPPEYASKVLADLLADNAHPTDPGDAYWASQFAALVSRYSRQKP